MLNGWVCLHRSLIDWEWYKEPNTKNIFIHCVLRANHSPGKWKGIDVQRGQFISSNQKLSLETGISISKIRTALKNLKLTNDLAIKSGSQHTVITVVNYDKYQSVDKPLSKPMTNRSQTDDKPIATNNKNNKKNNDNKIDYECGFDELWNIYHQGNKQRALKAWVKIMKDHKDKTVTREDLASNIIYATSGRLKSDPQWQNPKYRGHTSTYLNGKGWEDNWQDSAEEQINYENTQRPTTAFEQSQAISNKISEDYQTSLDALRRQREQGDILEDETKLGPIIPY